MHFKEGDTVIYGTFGVCIIKELCFVSFCPGSPKEYYFLLSKNSNPATKFYIPLKSCDEALRFPLCPQEISGLLEKAKALNLKWSDHKQTRYDLFNEIISKGVSEELVALLYCIHQKKLSLDEQKKTLSSTDEGFLTSAERLIHEEFSLSLGISGSDVNQFIFRHMSS